MSLINKEINDFSVQSFQNGEFKAVSKADVLGKWSIFFFYPADFTFVCPTELEDMANLYGEFKAAGCEVYSVSTDSHFVHKAWHDTSEKIQKIQYPMLAARPMLFPATSRSLSRKTAWLSAVPSSSTPRARS